MSDESAVNGGITDVAVEVAANEDDDSETTNQTIQKPIQQNQQLINDNELSSHKIKQLEDQTQTLESDKKALTSIAARAAVLETEVSRLQHDLISSVSEAQESSGEISQLKRVVEELKESDNDKKMIIDAIEKERNLLLERLNEFKEKLNESEREIERLKAKQSDQRIKDEEDGRMRIVEKEDEIRNSNRTVDELRSEVVKNRADVGKLEKEKEELEVQKKDLELEIDELKKDLEAYEKINRVVEEKRKVDWQAVAALAAAVALIGVVYFRHTKF